MSSKRTRKKTKVSSSDIAAKVSAIKQSSAVWLQQHQNNAEFVESSSESDEENNALSTTLTHYCNELGKDGVDISGLAQLSHSSSCLICLSALKRTEAIWSCSQCFCIFHIMCVQHWARDGLKLQTSALSVDLFPGAALKWACPKCRKEYTQVETPKQYICFCGKKTDPPFDPWLLPHSCGDICEKPLPSGCSHTCVLLCHPGPCPPCPKTLLISCYCGHSSPEMKRCGTKGWSCGRICRCVLSCDLHTCEDYCHEDECRPCVEVITESCACGRNTKDTPCSQPNWSCDMVCSKPLSCGQHYCNLVCHSGDCGQCPRAGLRTCPCGKTNHHLPCIVDIPTCGDTCSKDLDCGLHKCMRPCHYGACGPCLQVAMKPCRCGKKSKQVSCLQEFLCETRCTKLRQCHKHQCRRKCCDGNCPPCEQICGKLLGCKNHKCSAPCHEGRCYPCVLTVQVQCACGLTNVTVPCGSERRTKPPRCKQKCKKPSKCHHTVTKPHNCHMGDCPPCTLLCGKVLACRHYCGAICHTQPKPPQQVRPAGMAPWMKVEPTSLEPVVEPCPPCKQLISKDCRGGHEICELMCNESGQEFSCGRECGRSLECGNHTCARGCHVVINAPSNTEAGDDCLPCERMCEKQDRDSGCTHKCSLPCHGGDCPKCTVLVKILCHCSTMNLFVKCSEWANAENNVKNNLKACNSQCTKILACGHRCAKVCHAGNCSEQCKRKLTVRCPCRRMKKECVCSAKEGFTVQCDEECVTLMKLKQQTEVQAEEQRIAALLEEKRAAQETLERQLQPRRRRRTHKNVSDNAPQLSRFWNKTKIVIIGSALFLVIIVILLYIRLL